MEEHQRKLGLFKDLGGEFDDDVAQEMAYRIVETLLTVSKGRPPNDHNRRGFYPYGRLAGNAHTHQSLSLFRTHTHTHTHTHIHTYRKEVYADHLVHAPRTFVFLIIFVAQNLNSRSQDILFAFPFLSIQFVPFVSFFLPTYLPTYLTASAPACLHTYVTTDRPTCLPAECVASPLSGGTRTPTW